MSHASKAILHIENAEEADDLQVQSEELGRAIEELCIWQTKVWEEQAEEDARTA